MSEENKGASKNKWSRIFRQKWFFPALYLTLAAVLVSAVVWYQTVDNQTADESEEQDVNQDYTSEHPDEDAAPVMDPDEVIEMPVSNPDEAEIVTKFYDYNADEAEQEDSLILYNNRYYQSTGLDIAGADGESFDVIASLSGTVSEVKEDPLLGNLVVLSHDNEVMTYYASLGEISVQAGDEVNQGDSIGTAGKNLFGKDNGTHVHFELRKDGQEVNPEEFFNQPVSSLDSVTEEVMEDSAAEEPDEAEESEEADEAESQEESDLLDDLSGIEEPDEEDGEEEESADSQEDSPEEKEDPADNQDENTEEE